MRITHNKNKSTTRYQLSGTELRNVSNYKDLRVNMASDLTWTKHVEETVHKANKVLSLLKPTAGSKNKRTLFQFCTRPSFDRSWNTLARCGHHIQPKTSMKLRSYKGELRESPQAKDDRKWRMRTGVKYSNGTLQNEGGNLYPWWSAIRSY